MAVIKTIKILPKIIIICGPTCSGKTKFAIDLASRFNGEIVGADSVQIYRHMDIGTAKPTSAEQTKIYHHMIDIIDPDQHFDVVKYSLLAHDSIKRILSRGSNVFIVGGTGFYIKTLRQGIFKIKTTNDSIRNYWKHKANKYGAKWLHQRLSEVDNISAIRIHENDVFRVIRALEIFEVTNITMTDLQKDQEKMSCPYDILNIGLEWSREKLYQKINQRVDNMIKAGFVEEVERLLSSGYNSKLKSMQSLGYKHIVHFLSGMYSLDETLNTLKRDHRRYAKRQLTWFNADPTICWLTVDQVTETVTLINTFLQ